MPQKIFFARRWWMALPWVLLGGAHVLRRFPMFRRARPVPELKREAAAKAVAPEAAFDEIVEKLGIDMNMETDPNLFNDILKKDMLLDDYPDKERIFGEKLEKPWSAAEFLGRIREGFLGRDTLVEYSGEAVARGLIPEPNPEIVKRAIHHTILLEDLTVAMADSLKTMDELLEFVMAKREDKLGIPRKFPWNFRRLYKITGSVFEVAKIVTMDWVFSQYSEIRQTGIQDLTRRQISLSVNIIEALLTENSHGFKQNALAGVGLAFNPFSDAWLTDDGRQFIKYKFNEQWTNLYESWNLAFVTGNEENLHLIYTKLFIPSVMSAEHNDYLFNRALSLWATAQFVIFAKATGRPQHDMAGKEELAAPWGVMNARYAEAYVKEHNNANLRSFWSMLWLLLRMIF